MNFHKMRVPFDYYKEVFKEYSQKPIEIPQGYELHRINERIVTLYKEMTIQNEVLKLGESLEKFYQTGLGYCETKDSVVIGTCISVFVSAKEYEIGINTYVIEHRGKGLASLVAMAFIRECLKIEVNPHWVTEDFRMDSIAIAKKMGFKELPKYVVYFIPFDKWNEI
jgi:RimJ/RimL family protein N-acetyltransferase